MSERGGLQVTLAINDINEIVIEIKSVDVDEDDGATACLNLEAAKSFRDALNKAIDEISTGNNLN